MTKIGILGEQLVAQWLSSLGWIILHHRWRCRWGEIDLIARDTNEHTIAFVEVKTRSLNNWDADGLLAITAKKKINLSRTAAFFLEQSQNLADFPCRFDVALVSYKPNKRAELNLNFNYSNLVIKIGKPVFDRGYELCLIDYIQSAFDTDY